MDQRVIKFRAWDTRSKKWIEEFDISHHGELGRINMFETYEALPYAILMQFTGLVDKNDKELYEGDIIKYPNKSIKSVVCFGNFEYNPDEETHENGVGFYLQYYVNGIKELRVENILFFDISYNEIIGNIHEHPELLK